MLVEIQHTYHIIIVLTRRWKRFGFNVLVDFPLPNLKEDKGILPAMKAVAGAFRSSSRQMFVRRGEETVDAPRRGLSMR